MKKKVSDRPSALLVAPPLPEYGVLAPPHRAVACTAGWASSPPSIPTAVKSQELIVDVPRSVLHGAGAKRAAVIERGDTVAHWLAVPSGAFDIAAKASAAEID
jgi:hypothetical protein